MPTHLLLSARTRLGEMDANSPQTLRAAFKPENFKAGTPHSELPKTAGF